MKEISFFTQNLKKSPYGQVPGMKTVTGVMYKVTLHCWSFHGVDTWSLTLPALDTDDVDREGGASSTYGDCLMGEGGASGRHWERLIHHLHHLHHLHPQHQTYRIKSIQSHVCQGVFS